MDRQDSQLGADSPPAQRLLPRKGQLIPPLKEKHKTIYRPFNYASIVRLHIKPNLAAIQLRDLVPQYIQTFYNSLSRPAKNKKALSAKYIKDIHGVFHKALDQAMRLGYIRTNPTEACIIPKYRRKEIVPLNQEQLRKFLSAIQGHGHQYLYMTALFTGMREGELLGLQWQCINFGTGLILIDKQLQRNREKGGEYYFCPPKNGKSRYIMAAPSVLAILKKQKEKQMEQKEKASELWVETDLVFTNEIGDRLSYRTVYDCFKRIAESIGCPRIRYNKFRKLKKAGMRKDMARRLW